MRTGGSGHADRVGAEHGLPAEGRDHGDVRGVGGGEADHPVGECQRRVVGGGAEVTRVPDGHDPDAVDPRLGDGQLHGHRGGGVAEPLLGVQERRGHVVPDHARLRPGDDEAGPDPLGIAGEHPDAVGVHAAEVGPDHEPSRQLSRPPRHLERLQDRHDEPLERLVSDKDWRLGHRSEPCDLDPGVLELVAPVDRGEERRDPLDRPGV
ncbi:MAG: hypothetical protein FD129_3377, partial [bacterium]